MTLPCDYEVECADTSAQDALRALVAAHDALHALRGPVAPRLLAEMRAPTRVLLSTVDKMQGAELIGEPPPWPWPAGAHADLFG